ncbi:MAG TPA: hypothetical protein VMM12_18010 [Longimicrobiales bacterium]|nr:hypothetical protein [Longimicrobiales bacterium]
MIAYFTRVACVCATVSFMVALPASARGQVPTSGASHVVSRILLEWAIAERAAAPVAPAAGKAARGPVGQPLEGDAVAAPDRAAVDPLRQPLVREAVERLLTIRSGATRDFLARQLQFPRVRRAFETRDERVARMFRDAGVSAPEVFFRVFKRELLLEVWVRDREAETFDLLSTYPVCRVSGRMGPKRREGDQQVPEGFYEIDLLNPSSDYHLSMRVDYPNAVDEARGGGERLGGDIYIHGGCETIGCVPVTDRWIEELYLVAIHARDAGQESIPVHIFPTRLDSAGLAWLATTYGTRFVDFPFWQNLQEGYLSFERSGIVPAVAYDGARYAFPLPSTPVPPAPAPPSGVAAEGGG